MARLGRADWLAPIPLSGISCGDFGSKSVLVGVAVFEPATPSSRTRCATKLRYIPKRSKV